MAQPVVRHCPAGTETLPKPRSRGRGRGGRKRSRGVSPHPPFSPVVAESQGLPRPLGPRRPGGKKHLRLPGAIFRPLRAFARGRAGRLSSSPAQTWAARGARSPPLRATLPRTPPRRAPLPRPTDLGKARTSLSPSLARRSAEDERGFALSGDPLTRRRRPRLPSPTPYNLITRDIK